MSIDGQSTPAPDESVRAAVPAPRRAVIVGGNRIPFARSGGAYAKSSNQDMLTAALDGLIARFGLQDERIGQVAAGAVLKHSRDFNLTREAVLGSALSAETPVYDLQQACATGLETVVGLSNKIKLGQIDSAIAGGVDSASDAPVVVSEGLREVILDLNRAKTLPQRLQILSRLRPKDLAPLAPGTAEPRTGLSMGEHQALTTAQWKVSREAQDELALNSHRNLAAAYESGFFDDLLTPYRGLTRDGNLRADTSLEKLASLKPVFGRNLGAGATMTAGNSTPLTDGASTVLLASDDWARERGLEVLAYVTQAQTAAVDHVHRGDGLLMAPVFAMPRMLDRAGIGLADFDLYEIHEAFAAQVLCTLKAWADPVFCRERLDRDAPLGTIDPDRLNVNGGSLAAGHPFAATGGRIVGGLAKALHERGSGQGVISICAAGGQGVVAVLEKPEPSER